MIYRDYFKSPLGLIYIEANELFLKKCSFVEEQKLKVNSNFITKEAQKYFHGYFNNEKPIFNKTLINFKKNFSGKVHQALFNNVSFGKKVSYKELGKLINSHAYRAIGSALGKNTIVIIVPCHRIVRSDGTIGNYTYCNNVQTNSYIKKYLIDHEQ